MKKVPHVYCASGWFNSNDEEIISAMESYLEKKMTEGLCTIHRPRVDGVKLDSNQFHSSILRKRVFDDNVVNIDKADIVYANLTIRSSERLDTGTVWEVGYAIAKGKLVIILDDGGDLETFKETFSGLVSRSDNVYIVTDQSESENLLSTVLSLGYTKEDNLIKRRKPTINHPLVFLPYENQEEYDTLFKTSQEIFGKNVGYCTNYRLSNSSHNILTDIRKYPYLVIPTTKRDPILIFIMGVAYAKKVPVVTYSSDDSGINLMLICSVLCHVVGEEGLSDILTMIIRDGVSNIRFDDSRFKVY